MCLRSITQSASVAATSRRYACHAGHNAESIPAPTAPTTIQPRPRTVHAGVRSDRRPAARFPPSAMTTCASIQPSTAPATASVTDSAMSTHATCARCAQHAHDREVVATLVERLRQRDEQPQRRRRHQQQRERPHEVERDAEHREQPRRFVRRRRGLQRCLLLIARGRLAAASGPT